MEQIGEQKSWYSVSIENVARFAVYTEDEEHAKLLADYRCDELGLYHEAGSYPLADLVFAKPVEPSEETVLETVRTINPDSSLSTLLRSTAIPQPMNIPTKQFLLQFDAGREEYIRLDTHE